MRQLPIEDLLLPAEVHQATGMAAVQLDVSTDLAFALLVAEAERQTTSLEDLAGAVVIGSFRFS